MSSHTTADGAALPPPPGLANPGAAAPEGTWEHVSSTGVHYMQVQSGTSEAPWASPRTPSSGSGSGDASSAAGEGDAAAAAAAQPSSPVLTSRLLAAAAAAAAGAALRARHAPAPEVLLDASGLPYPLPHAPTTHPTTGNVTYIVRAGSYPRVQPEMLLPDAQESAAAAAVAAKEGSTSLLPVSRMGTVVHSITPAPSPRAARFLAAAPSLEDIRRRERAREANLLVATWQQQQQAAIQQSLPTTLEGSGAGAAAADALSASARAPHPAPDTVATFATPGPAGSTSLLQRIVALQVAAGGGRVGPSGGPTRSQLLGASSSSSSSSSSSGSSSGSGSGSSTGRGLPATPSTTTVTTSPGTSPSGSRFETQIVRTSPLAHQPGQAPPPPYFVTSPSAGGDVKGLAPLTAAFSLPTSPPSMEAHAAHLLHPQGKS